MCAAHVLKGPHEPKLTLFHRVRTEPPKGTTRQPPSERKGQMVLQWGQSNPDLAELTLGRPMPYFHVLAPGWLPKAVECASGVARLANRVPMIPINTGEGSHF
jgi:hypothetical protein